MKILVNGVDTNLGDPVIENQRYRFYWQATEKITGKKAVKGITPIDLKKKEFSDIKVKQGIKVTVGNKTLLRKGNSFVCYRIIGEVKPKPKQSEKDKTEGDKS